MMTMRLVYDDTVPVPVEVGAATGIGHFGDLIYRRETLSRRVLAAAGAAGITEVVHLRTAAESEAFLGTLLTSGAEVQRSLYLPANIIASGPLEATAEALARLRHVRRNVTSTAVFTPGVWAGLALCDRDTLRALLEQRQAGDLARFMAESNGHFEDVSDGVPLLDLAHKATLLEFLTSHFEARHFNAIAYDRFTVRKASADSAKIRREYAFWGLLPEAMKPFFVQPYDLREEAGQASYAMERLNVPDMALQWVHGALDMPELSRFLDRAFHFLSSRPKRSVSRAEAEAVRHDLYLAKLEARLAGLRDHALWPRLQDLLTHAGRPDGLDTLVGRYRSLHDRLASRRKDTVLVVGHGDFCFSNILYDKTIGLMKLIDPRGAMTEDDLWTDPYYDAAKLSHSVLGGYDFINNGLFDLTLDEALVARLSLTLRKPLPEASNLALERFFEAGFDPALVRLYEASLFLSMVPLHMDVPNKGLAFLINAEAVLEAAEALA